MVSALIYSGYFLFELGFKYSYLLFINLLGPIILAMLMTINNLISSKNTPLKQIFVFLKKYFFRGLIAFSFSIFIYAIIIFDIYFFFIESSDTFIMMSSGIIFLYLFIIFSLIQIHFWSILTIKPEENIKFALKQALYLTISNFFYSLALLFFLLVFSLILTFTGIGIIIAAPGFISTLLINGCVLNINN